MIAKRIIPCLDVKNGRVVKGTNFVNLKDAGDAIELAGRYSDEGADELVFLDISASIEKRKTFIEFVRETAKTVSIPFTVGGGISELSDIEALLKAGADKVSLNTSIVKNPSLITESAKNFGSQATVAAIDVNKLSDGYRIYIKGGKEATDIEGISWCKRVEELGAGEILLTAMHCDGTRAGYDTEFLNEISKFLKIPVIASGGAGNYQHFLDAFVLGHADACLAAGLFHYGEMKIKDLKVYLTEQGINIRL